MNQKYKTTEKWVSRVPLVHSASILPAGTEFIVQSFVDSGIGFMETDKGLVPTHFIYGFCTHVLETKISQGLPISNEQTP